MLSRLTRNFWISCLITSLGTCSVYGLLTVLVTLTVAFPVFVRSSGADSDTNQIVVAMCKHSGQVDITIIEATIGDECIDGFRDESLERACESADDLGVKKVTISAFSVDEIQAIRDVCDYVLRDLGAES